MRDKKRVYTTIQISKGFYIELKRIKSELHFNSFENTIKYLIESKGR